MPDGEGFNNSAWQCRAITLTAIKKICNMSNYMMSKTHTITHTKFPAAQNRLIRGYFAENICNKYNNVMY